jgi:hypothetical protein
MRFSPRILARIFTISIVLSAIGVNPVTADTPIRNNKIVNVLLFVRDSAGQPLTPQSDPSTLVSSRGRWLPLWHRMGTSSLWLNSWQCEALSQRSASRKGPRQSSISVASCQTASTRSGC